MLTLPFDFKQPWLISKDKVNNIVLLFFLRLGWLAHFGPKHLHLWDTEPFSFLSGMMAGYSHGVYICAIIIGTDEEMLVIKLSESSKDMTSSGLSQVFLKIIVSIVIYVHVTLVIESNRKFSKQFFLFWHSENRNYVCNPIWPKKRKV